MIRRFPLDTGPLPEAAELLRRFASARPPGAVDDWAGWLDREVERLHATAFQAAYDAFQPSA